MINWMKYRWLYLLVSGIVILSGIYSLLMWGLPLGIEFKGGTVIEYSLGGSSQEQFESVLKITGIEYTSVQKTANDSVILKLGQITSDQRTALSAEIEKSEIKAEELRFEKVGPTIGPELVRKTLYGMLLASFGILFWVALQFKSVKFGVSAVLAMLHDSLVLVGTYSILGHFMGAEVDLLFVTALLTTLSFSVHDTIVLYDRIRESKHGYGDNFYDLANKAISETMVRSLNNSFVVVFMLVSFLLLGGTTIRWFISALLIGTISGAYSSPFVAVSLLVSWDQLQTVIRRRKNRK